MDYPLSGLKVLDFSRVLAGPFAGRMLSDLGADVVKVEPPEGDVTRFWGKSIANLPGYYHQQNAGKRNICADLREPAAIAVIEALVGEADIVIENYRADVMGRLGLGYHHLKTINPRIIMLSISGFGHGGPESRRPAYAPVIHAEAGLIHRSTSARRRTPIVASTIRICHYRSQTPMLRCMVSWACWPPSSIGKPQEKDSTSISR